MNLRDAKRTALRALALEPQGASARRGLVLSYINGEGDIIGARRAIGKLATGTKLATNARGSVAHIINEGTYLSARGSESIAPIVVDSRGQERIGPNK